MFRIPVVALMLIANSFSAALADKAQVVSYDGSDRATSYGFTTRIVLEGHYGFFVWLDDPKVGRVLGPERQITNSWADETVMFGYHDFRSGEITTSLLPTINDDNHLLDNHANPSLMMDSERHLIMVIGGHTTNPFEVWKTTEPVLDDSGNINPNWEIGAWRFLFEIGADSGTYPSTAMASDDDWFVTYRGGAPEPRQIRFRAIIGGELTDPISIFQRVNSDQNYRQYSQSIVVDQDDRIHMIFSPESSEGEFSLGIGYLTSVDKGATWKVSNGNTVLDTRSAGGVLTELNCRECFISTDSGGSRYFKPSNLTVSEAGDLAFLLTSVRTTETFVFHRKYGLSDWQPINVTESIFNELGRLGYETSAYTFQPWEDTISFRGQGSLLAAIDLNFRDNTLGTDFRRTVVFEFDLAAAKLNILMVLPDVSTTQASDLSMACHQAWQPSLVAGDDDRALLIYTQSGLGPTASLCANQDIVRLITISEDD